MKFTAQEEYGLRCILSLARLACGRSAGAGPAERPAASLTVSEVAEVEGLSEQYAGKLFRILAKGGLVEAVRGRGGGYRLSRPPEQIHVAEALAALGGKFYDGSLCDRFKGNRRFCVHTNDCSIRSLWAGIQLMIDQVLSRTTLRDLVTSETTMAQWLEPHVDVLRGPERRISPARASARPEKTQEPSR